MTYGKHSRGAGSRKNGPVDRVYHFAEDSHQDSHVSPNLRSRKNRSRAHSGSTGSMEYTTGSGSHETIDGSNAPLPPPPGLKNVGNSCYANAALQCLLSTALPHALLDERNAHIIRRHSFNRKLLVHGSGSVDSDVDTKSTCSADGTYGSCLSGMTGIYEDEEDDDIILARAMGDGERDGDALKGLRASPHRKGRRKRLSLSKKKKQQQPGDDATVESATTMYSDMYQVMKRREQKETSESDADLLCAWLTQELTQITREYTTPPQGFKAEKRRSKSAGSGREYSPTNFLGAFFGGSSSPGSDAPLNRVVDPGSITRHVHKISPCLRPYQQEDAHEFFRSLLSSLTMHGQNARLSSLFDGLLESSVTCQTCRKTSLTRDRYMDLSLDIADSSVTTLERALEKFTEEETLCHDNMVTCSRCKVKRTVTKGLRLATAPTMLVINYKRFAYDNYGRLSRLSKQVQFPLKLEMGNYMSRANRGKPPPYTLVAVLVHRGRSCDCGHYFAYVRKGKDWYLANDAEVTKVDIETVLNSQAYVLVYEVAGMKEKHNFDCYSRYHRSLDEADEEALEREKRDDGNTSWDFSLSGLLEACDATLCGSANNVDDTVGKSRSKNSFEDDTPPRKGASKTQQRSTIEDELDAPHHKMDNAKAYYKRGRSHTPSRQNRSRDQGGMSRERELRSSLHDSEPPDPGHRRAKSLSRARREECRSKNRSKPSRKRVPSRLKNEGPSSSGQELPPLHEQRSGSSTRGVMHSMSP